MLLPAVARPALAATAAVAVTAVLTGFLTGCSASVSTGAESVSAERLADEIDGRLQDLKDEKSEVKDLTCDGDLEAEEGAEQLCHFDDVVDDRYGVTVTVTGVEGDELSYDVAVDPGQTVEPDELEPEVTDQLTELSGGTPPDDLDCPDDLPGRVDATTTCVLTAGQDRLEVTVTVTSADGPDVGFDIEVADETMS